MSGQQLLRKFVSNLILERAATFWQNTAMIVSNNVIDEFIPAGGKIYLVMENSYWTDMPKYASLIKNDMLGNAEQIARMAMRDGHIYGMIAMKPPVPGVAYGASETIYTAAKPKYGPALYDLVMGEQEVGMYPDRTAQDPRAHDIYDFYLKRRKDIKKLPLDDPDHQFTPDTIDDMKATTDGTYLPWGYQDNPSHDLWLEDAANYVYQNSRHPNASKYLQRGDEQMASIAKRWGHNPKDIEEFFGQVALAFFELRERQAT